MYLKIYSIISLIDFDSIHERLACIIVPCQLKNVTCYLNQNQIAHLIENYIQVFKLLEI